MSFHDNFKSIRLVAKVYSYFHELQLRPYVAWYTVYYRCKHSFKITTLAETTKSDHPPLALRCQPAYKLHYVLHLHILNLVY